MRININKFNKLKDNGLLMCEKHEVSDLLVWNYTEKAILQKKMTRDLKMTRGLITDLKGKVISRPFKKFLKFGEKVINEDFKVFNKLDGSLGISYWMKGEPYLATRDSFVSDQAMMGSVLLRRYNWTKMKKKYTYLFEIIYPENKKIIDYGGAKAIILLGVIDTKTGKDINIKRNHADFPYTQEVPVENKSISELKDDQKYNQRGYILLFKSGERMSVEFDNYIKAKK